MFQQGRSLLGLSSPEAYSCEKAAIEYAQESTGEEESEPLAAVLIVSLSVKTVVPS